MLWLTAATLHATVKKSPWRLSAGISAVIPRLGSYQSPHKTTRWLAAWLLAIKLKIRCASEQPVSESEPATDTRAGAGSGSRTVPVEYAHILAIELC